MDLLPQDGEAPSPLDVVFCNWHIMYLTWTSSRRMEKVTSFLDVVFNNWFFMYLSWTSSHRMEQASSSLDVVFSNWLFMYLSDEESQRLLQKVLTWLKPDGHLFFRESCFHQSGETTL